MNILDIIFAVILGYFLIRGLMRGLIIELGALAGVILGFILANKYHSLAAPYVGKVVSDPGWASIISHLVIFLAVVVIVTFISRLLKELMTIVLPGWLDILGGLLVGTLKAAAICSIILFVLLHFAPEADFIKESKSVPYLKQFSEKAREYIPEKYIPVLPDANKTIT